MDSVSWKKFFEVVAFVVVFVVPVILYLMEKAGMSLQWIFAIGWSSIAMAALYLVLSIPWVWADEVPVRIWRACLVSSLALLAVGYGAVRIWPKNTPSKSEVASSGPPQGRPPGTRRESLPAITKSSSFSTVVPVSTVYFSRPVQRIPSDENEKDPRIDFYRDLGMLSRRPFKDPPGVTFVDKPLGDASVARVFLAELLQYYILQKIRVLQHGTLAFGVTKYLGQDKAVAKAIDVPPIPVPDAVPYSINELFRSLDGNEFLDGYAYSESNQNGVVTPNWYQPEIEYWRNSVHPFMVPRGTDIRFSGNDKDPERNVELERAGFYRLKFTVVPMFGGPGSLPENSYTSLPGVDSYSCRITMDYQIQQRADGGFVPKSYVEWAENLFAGIKNAMAP